MIGWLGDIPANARKLAAIRHVHPRRFAGMTAADLMRMAREAHAEAIRPETSRARKVALLWTVEGIGVALGRRRDFVFAGHGKGLAPALLPILMVGVGGGAVAAVNSFAPEVLGPRLEEAAHAEHLGWCWEGVGHQAGLQRAPLMRRLLAMPVITAPCELDSFPAMVRERINIGMGRLLYFASWSMDAVFRQLRREKLTHAEWMARVHGAMFARAMTNHHWMQPESLGAAAMFLGNFADGIGQ